MKSRFRTLEQIKAEFPEVQQWADEVKAAFGGYSKVKVYQLAGVSGRKRALAGKELVYSWEKKEKFVEPTNLLRDDRQRKPTTWRNDK